MKKAIVPLAILATVLVLTGIVVWLFYTETGAQYLVTRLIRFVPARIETAGISGTLASELAVSDLRVTGEGRRLTVGKTILQWRPWELPMGKVVLAKLVFQEVTLQDDRPDEPLDLNWPRFPRVLSWFQGRVDQLEIRGLAFRKQGKEIMIQRVYCRLDSSYGFVRVHDLLVEGSSRKMTGTIQTHLMSPFLAADVKIAPKGSWPMTALQVRLRAPSGSMYVNGPFTAKIFGGPQERFTLNGRVSFDRHALAFTDLSLEERERKGAVKGEGKVDFSRAVPVIQGVVRAEDLDLSREAGMECRLTGTVDIAGNISSYQGHFRLRPYFSAWEPGEAAGIFSGDHGQASIEELRMNLGKGTIKGRMNITWKEEGLAAIVTLQARNIDPSRAAPVVNGNINADLEGFLRWPPGASVEAAVKGRLLSSQLMGKRLTGSVNARWKDEGLNLDDLSLQGDGFHVRARGAAARDRILYEARVTKLSRLLPMAEGQFQGQGWFRFRNRLLSGNLVAVGKGIAFDHTTIESLTADLSLTEDGNKDLQARVTAKNLSLWEATWRQAELKIGGTRNRHRADLLVTNPENGLRIQAAGSYQQEVWTGIIQDVFWDSKRFGPLTIVNPVNIVATRHALSLAPLLLTGRQGEHLELAARMDGQKKQERLSVGWQDLQLGRVNIFTAGTEMAGKTTGQMNVEWPEREQFRLSGTAMLKGEISHGTWKLPIREGQTRIRWDEKGLDMRQSLDFGEKGKVAAVLSSPAPPAGAIPGEGTFQVRLTDMDFQLIKPLLPPSLETEGRLSGQAEGRLLPQQRFIMKGQSTVSGGAWTVAYPKGKVQFSQERLALAWSWQDDALQGTLESKFVNHGQIRSTFSLPIKAQIPLKIDKKGPLSIVAKGDLREKGLLSALFPGTIRETHGQLAIDLAMTGSWQSPIYQGTVRLDRAEAYVPATGIRLEDVEAVARFYQDRIEVEQISARSGAGSIKGAATLWYGDRKIRRIKGSLAGERFQAAYLPELQIMVNPRLTFEGPPDRLILRGAIDVPEGRYTESKKPDMIHTSRDVRVVDRGEKKPKPQPVVMDIDLSITLGGKVFMKTRDIEGKFTGKMNAAGRSLDNLRTRGEIHISQGILYAADAKLPIERGHIFFKDKPFPLASLDILAVKKVGDVRAGFLVTGTIRSPVVTLYSVPSMSDQDVLAHIVFGTSYTGDKIQAATLLKSAGMFLAQGQSGGLEDSLRKSAGVEIGGLTSSNRPRQGRTDMTTSSLSTVGQYLSPQLYVGLGRALFSDDILYVMKYSFTKQWEVETKAGKQSSLDLFFKIEFD